jgi:hypothetical protein
MSDTYIQELLRQQKKTNELLQEILNLFKRYEIDEVTASEAIREEQS